MPMRRLRASPVCDAMRCAAMGALWSVQPQRAGHRVSQRVMPRFRPLATCHVAARLQRLAKCRATLPPGCNAWQRVVPRFAARLQCLATCRTVAGSAPPPNDEPALPPRTLPPQPQQRGQPSAAAGRYVSGAAEREGPAGSLGSLLAQQVRVGHPFPVVVSGRTRSARYRASRDSGHAAVVALRCNVAALQRSSLQGSCAVACSADVRAATCCAAAGLWRDDRQ
jgi:hypothetical protein